MQRSSSEDHTVSGKIIRPTALLYLADKWKFDDHGKPVERSPGDQ